MIYFASLLVAVAYANTEEKFVKYCSEFGKYYDTVEEFALRMERFIEMDAEIEKLN